MAQYYQVLSQDDKLSEQYYENVVGNHTVQYVISPDTQTYQGQPIVVASEQLMLIDNSTQQILVDQPVAYQNSQYIVESTEFQPQQQIYYMDDTSSDTCNHIQEVQPVVLNHSLSQSQMSLISNCVTKSAPQTRFQQPQPQQQIRGTQPIRTQPPGCSVTTTQSSTTPRKLPQQNQIQRQSMQTKIHNQNQSLGSSGLTLNRSEIPALHFTQPKVKQTEIITEADKHEAVALEDGSIVSLSTYKKMLADCNKSKTATNPSNQNKCFQNQTKPKTNKTYASPAIRTKPQLQPRPASNTAVNNESSVPQRQIVASQQTKQYVQNHYTEQPASGQLVPQYIQPQYIIQPPSQHTQQPSCPLPPCVASSQIQQIIEDTPVSDEYSDSIRMLVLLEDGEQRLITFTLPKESCTLQEILEQVGVTIKPDTKIECTETNDSGINYLVTVGSHTLESCINHQNQENNNDGVNSQKTEPEVPSKEPSPEPPAELEPPKYIPGLLAVCNHCGYTSECFSKCSRCGYKLPDDVKSIPASTTNSNLKRAALKTAGSPKLSLGNLQKKRKPKVVDPDPVILTLSSDDESDETQQNVKKHDDSSLPVSTVTKEPSVSDICKQLESEIKTTETSEGNGSDQDDMNGDELTITLPCRTVRIGSYKYHPQDNIIIYSKGVELNVPTPDDPTNFKKILIEQKHILKVLVNYQKALPVLFYYVGPCIAKFIRQQLNMVEGSEIYFDPLSTEEEKKRITFLPEYVSEETRVIFKHIYSKPENKLDLLTSKEANGILMKICPREVGKVITSTVYSDIKKVLIYPPGKGGISINTEDYSCLGQDQFLNDVIIDFYLKYLVLQLPKEQQGKVHVFSTFFYKRLTTKPTKPNKRSHPAEVDSSLTAAQKRHARVEKWTKSVNLFEKDFIIIPINENSHWFLAIICFPGQDGCLTMDNKPAMLPTKTKNKKSIKTLLPASISLALIKKEKEEKLILCDEEEASDKDEAEGDDSELESGNESEESSQSSQEVVTKIENKKTERSPIKQSSILIFDSLAGASRARVVATLRDYLTCEHKVKMGTDKVFNKDAIKGSCPKVPQQTNFTDCGLYLLQYVEQFFQDPIRDYHTPIKQLKDWFDEFVVTKKREDISNLIKKLMVENNGDPNVLPDLQLPTCNGKLQIQEPENTDEFGEEYEEEDETMPGEESESVNSGPDQSMDTSATSQELEDACLPLPVPRTLSNQIKITLNSSSTLIETDVDKSEKQPHKLPTLILNNVVSSNSTVSVLPNNSNSSNSNSSSSRETLSYLKSKRINRHKNNANENVKRFKPSE